MEIFLKKEELIELYSTNIKCVYIEIRPYNYTESSTIFIKGFVGIIRNNITNKHYSSYIKYQKVFSFIDIIKILSKELSSNEFFSDSVFLKLQK